MAVPKVGRNGRMRATQTSVQHSSFPVVPQASAGPTITVEQIADYMQHGIDGVSMDSRVTYRQAMTLSAIQTCVRLIGGGVSNTPVKVVREIDEKTTELAIKSDMWRLFRKRPCSYLRPSQFFRMSVAHIMLRGNFFAMKVKGLNGKLLELKPMDPNRCTVDLRPDGVKIIKYSRPSDGKILEFTTDQVLHLFLLSFDGITGVTPIHYASSSLSTSIEMEKHGRSVFQNGARMGGLLSTEKKLGPEGRKNVREALDEHRSNGQSEGKELVLEEGMKFERMSMTAQDSQWIEARKLGKADLYEIFGIPHHMTALSEKQSNWGTGVEQHNRQFIQWTLEDYYKMWEDAFNCDLIPDDSDLVAMFDRDKLLRGDVKSQAERDQTDLQYRIRNPNEVRRDRGLNPYEGGDEFAPWPNATTEPQDDDDGDDNNPQEPEDK